MTAEERGAARSSGGTGGRHVFLLMLFGLVPGFLLAKLFSGVAGGSDLGRALGWTAGAASFVAAELAFRRSLRAAREASEKDLAGGEVEVVRVETDRAIALEGDHSSVHPALAVDVGGGKVLFLCGQWAWDEERFGAEPAPDDEGEAWWNRCRPPHAFPSRRFTLTRLPSTGEVLRIDVEGEYLEPEQRPDVVVELASRNPKPSQLLTGSLDDLEAALPPVQPKDRVGR
jgi:hypothetical protein